MVGAKSRGAAWLCLVHPSQSIELWQLGSPSDGESAVLTTIMHGKPESPGHQTAMALRFPPTSISSYAPKDGSLSTDMLLTSLASPGERARPSGWKATLALDIWTPLVRPAQDGSSANCSNQPWCLDSSCLVWQHRLHVSNLLWGWDWETLRNGECQLGFMLKQLRGHLLVVKNGRTVK